MRSSGDCQPRAFVAQHTAISSDVDLIMSTIPPLGAQWPIRDKIRPLQKVKIWKLGISVASKAAVLKINPQQQQSACVCVPVAVELG